MRIGEQPAPARPDNRIRPLGALETYLADMHTGQLGATQFVCTAELAGGLDESAADRALRALTNRHPLLRTELHRQDGCWWYVPTDLPPPWSIVSASDSFEGLVLAGERINRPVAGPGPLWEATVLVDRRHELSTLVFAAHHAITDGVSMLTLAQQFVDTHNRVATGLPLNQPAFPRRAPIERLLPPVARATPPARCTAEEFVPGWAVERAAPVAQRRIRTLWHTMGPADTAALLSRCRAEGVTVNSAIVAALAVAAQRLPTSRDALSCLIPISVRDQTKPLVSALENGCFITEVSLTLGPADLAVPGWDRARSIRERYLRLRAAALAAPTDFEHWPANEQPDGPTFRRGSLVTNLGRGVPATSGGPLRLTSFRFVVSPRHGVYAVSISVATVAGRMVLGLSSADPLLGDSSAAAFAQAFTAELDPPR
ncbi:MAG TPA: condensation domain-containing protein [Pseudonocardiaceae bacterium]|nr:condensation domain-containing protein [Pseudonocardiaceae bacterium]